MAGKANPLALGFGVFGDPIAHSRSPAMHNAAFAELGLPHHYLPFHVRAPQLADALRGSAALGIGGVNLTIPHKQAAVALMDDLTDEARRIGAVNTVRFEQGRCIGHNTDGLGFLAGLKLLGTESPKRAVVLGGGGASLAVVDALVHGPSPCPVTWVSRRPGELPNIDGVDSIDYDGADAALDVTDLLVNTTSVGMPGGPSSFPRDVDLGLLHAEAKVVDIVYSPTPQSLFHAARARGLPTQDGLPMLLWQGVFALSFWLRTRLPKPVVEAMQAALQGPSPAG